MNGIVYRGILTGLNEAFVITEAKRAELIAADPKSIEIIKPWLNGRDIKRWRVENPNIYLIAIKNSNDSDANNLWGYATTEQESLHIFKQVFPSIYAHIMEHESELRSRSDQGKWWWELRTCAYYSAFENPKIIYPELSGTSRFTIDKDGFYTNKTAFIIPIVDEYLLGILNSNCVTWFMSNLANTMRGGYLMFSTIYVETIPIPNAPLDLGEKIAALARRCLEAAKDAPDILPTLEAKLNTLVYQAYGLNDGDIAVIEGYMANKETIYVNEDSLE